MIPASPRYCLSSSFFTSVHCIGETHPDSSIPYDRHAQISASGVAQCLEGMKSKLASHQSPRGAPSVRSKDKANAGQFWVLSGGD